MKNSAIKQENSLKKSANKQQNSANKQAEPQVRCSGDISHHPTR